MKTRTNQPVFFDSGERVDDSKLGGTKLYVHRLQVADSIPFYVISKTSTIATNVDTLDEVLFNATSALFLTDNGNSWALIDYGSSVINFMSVDEDTHSFVLDESFNYEENTISDTVTPL